MIGIIILTYNNWEETKRCIESIVNFPPEEDYHIYCIDNGSSVRSPFDFEKQYGKREETEKDYRRRNRLP